VKRDLRVQWQMFLGIAVFVAIIDIVYWFVSYERAGTTMLTLTAGLAALCGGWLFIQDHRDTAARSHPNEPQEGDTGGDDHYLPATSWWPLVIGVGVALAVNGLILSWPFAVPGGIVLMLGIGGFVSDSRRRA
jgi:hypothetical protein